MRLPSQFDDCDAYFCCAVDFLRDYEWVYNFPVTRILVNGIFEKVPNDWVIALLELTNDELNQLPIGLIKDSWPSSLIDFCKRCSALRVPPFEMPPYDVLMPVIPTQVKQNLALSSKKRHELSTLATVINKECQLQGISTILEIGSGLGYLGQVLHHWYGYRVLGLESDETRVKTANQKQLTLCPRSNSVSFITHQISPNSVDYIQDALKNHFSSSNTKSKKVGLPEVDQKPGSSDHKKKVHEPICPGCKMVEGMMEADSLYGTLPAETLASDVSERIKYLVKLQDKSNKITPVCMVGLHACGDLTVDAAEIFLRVPEIRSMILVPCCYHKMSLVRKEMHCGSNPSAECFRTFPASKSLKSVFDSTVPHPNTFLRRPFLRLAAQQTSRQWVNHSEQTHREKSMYVMARATLELLAHQEGFLLRKKHRRGVLKAQFDTFDTFIKSALERFEFVNPDGSMLESNSDILAKAEQLWAEYSSLCPLAEAVTGLQTMLQSVTEQLMSCDRMYFLKESGGDELFCDCVQVFNELRSPRCLALISRK